MLRFIEQIKISENKRDIVFKILPLLAFIVPLGLLYFLNPADPYLKISPQESFELMWKGRTFQLFFIWLVALEFILSWELIKLRINLKNKSKMLLFALVLILPTIYVISESYFGLNTGIVNWAQQRQVVFSDSMPLAFEYLVFSVIFCLIIGVSFGRNGLRRFALPVFFLSIVGLLYVIDNVFPYGEFTPFQLLVPTTTMLAAGVLGLLGNTAVMGTDIATGMPTLDVTGQLGAAKFAIAWPCAGIESLLIFAAVALLFFGRLDLSWKDKIGFFAIGAVITYFINILRIVTIFMLGMQYGVTSGEVQNFHFYYGPLYAMIWIISYPLIVIATQRLWQKTRKRQPLRLVPA